MWHLQRRISFQGFLTQSQGDGSDDSEVLRMNFLGVPMHGKCPILASSCVIWHVPMASKSLMFQTVRTGCFAPLRMGGAALITPEIIRKNGSSNQFILTKVGRLQSWMAIQFPCKAATVSPPWRAANLEIPRPWCKKPWSLLNSSSLYLKIRIFQLLVTIFLRYKHM